MMQNDVVYNKIWTLQGCIRKHTDSMYGSILLVLITI